MFRIYAETVARIIIILIGYVFAFVFFIFSVMGWIGEYYLTSFHSFIANTKARFAAFDEQTKTK